MTRAFSLLLLALSLLTTAVSVQAQAAYGDWQLHLPARRPLALALAGPRLYVADETAFYRYDVSARTTQTLSRRDGLSDVGVVALAYDSASAQLVVAYRNGNLDLLGGPDGGRVRNVTDLLRKSGIGAKTVFEIQIYNGLAYLSTSLGVVVLDLARAEVRDTYGAIGPGGQPVSAYATVVLRDTIFTATSAGILRGRLAAGINLLDYRAWTLDPPVPGTPDLYFAQLVAYRGHVVAASQFRGVDVLGGVGAARAWRYVNGSYGEEVRRLRATGGQLLVSFNNTPLRQLDPLGASAREVLPVSAIGRAVLDVVRLRDGTLLLAGYDRGGLLRFGSGQTTGELIRPNGPATALAYGLVADAATNTVVALSGGYAGSAVQFGRREGFYEYRAGQWTNYTAATFSPTDYPNLLDISHGARLADGTLYLASYGNGLLEWRGPGQWRQYSANTPGSPLRSSLPIDPQNPTGYLDFVRVTDVAADPSGSYLWVVNRHQRVGVPGLLRLRTGPRTWTSAPAFKGFDNLDRVVVDAAGNPWATASRQGGNGLVAYDTTGRQAYYFGSAEGLPTISTGSSEVKVLSLARDRDGAIWAGTTAGVAVCANPSRLGAPTDPARFTTPTVPVNGNSGFPALFTETVSCIAVDGANRKWFGTANGLWLFNPAGTEALLHFTTDNSPLPSNGIADVAVNDRTGEVFVATDAGLVSYQGSASLTEGAPACAQVFPNPVRPDFVGTVGIRGVANGAQVRITDVAGHLVFSTRAAGGTLTWNLTDASGQRVRSGMYLVLSADAEGKNTCVSKVAVLSN